MELHTTQKIVASDTHRFRVLNAGRRWGKTKLSVEEMKGFAVAREDGRVGYLAPTYQQARDIAWKDLLNSTRPMWHDKPNETRLEITVLNQFYNSRKKMVISNSGTQTPWLSTIVLRGWESVESFRGQPFDFLVPDEVAMYRHFWEGWHEVLRPTLTDRKGHALFTSTPKGFNHFYDLYNLERTEPSFKSFHYTTYDNPHIDPAEVDEARRQMTEDRFAQEYLADFRKQEGLVYKEFSRDIHLFDDFTPRRPTVRVLVGVDWGYTNPTAILKVERDSDDHYWVSFEWYKSQRQMTEIVQIARSLNANVYYPDPAEADRVEELSRAGCNVSDVSKDIAAGIGTVRDLLKQNRLHIHKDCINLISELETYAYEDTKPDKNAPEVPRKEHDHACDALRYVLHMEAPSSVVINSEPLAIY